MVFIKTVNTNIPKQQIILALKYFNNHKAKHLFLKEKIDLRLFFLSNLVE